ncbi:MAG: fructose-6-phosphate aldolase [Deltaproteobacteria bacterium]|nr:fructose-6-phosphate aldolase [Deltaproteobacteria bacterium]MBI4795332.1 fructose-6-phosphate aldolase [Deltaproteobacteria bacterium]
MKFFIDTANLDEIREAHSLGLVDGVTTNPSLCAKVGIKTDKQFEDLIRQICELVQGPVSAEVTAVDEAGMLAQARHLAKVSDCVVVKIPMTPDGLKATRILAQEGIKVNVTLIFQPLQALLAAKAGAAFVSPFIGRLDDISQRGMECVEQIVTIFENYGFDTEIIVASIRHPLHVLEGALAGADIATVPYGVIMQLIKHPLTDVGLKKFLEDWERARKG